ncbi:hypothetical protein Tco_1229006 [Tanacetum coccineum]
MTKVIKGEFEKIKDIKVEDDSLACDSPLEVFNCEVNRLSKMDDDLFTYEVEIDNIPFDLRVDDDSEHEADDIGFDPSDIAFTKCFEDSELKDEALRNKAIMEGFIKDDDDESNYEQMRQWDIYTNYDDTFKTNHDDNEREELCEVHEPPVCTIQRFEMIKYSFGQGEEYVAIKEDEYDDLA